MYLFLPAVESDHLKLNALNVPFYLTDKYMAFPVPICSVLSKPMKFLGSEITELNSQNVMFELLHSNLKSKLENIDESTLGGEHKAAIFSRFTLPSMIYYFSVHHVHTGTCHTGHMEDLDKIACKFLNKKMAVNSILRCD